MSAEFAILFSMAATAREDWSGRLTVWAEHRLAKTEDELLDRAAQYRQIADAERGDVSAIERQAFDLEHEAAKVHDILKRFG